MIQFFNHEVSGEPITNFNDIIKYILHDKTAGFYCDTQFEADMLNYIIQNESYGEVHEPGTYLWADDRNEYIFGDNVY
mgnify:CR=1 FL=1